MPFLSIFSALSATRSDDRERRVFQIHENFLAARKEQRAARLAVVVHDANRQPDGPPPVSSVDLLDLMADAITMDVAPDTIAATIGGWYFNASHPDDGCPGCMAVRLTLDKADELQAAVLAGYRVTAVKIADQLGVAVTFYDAEH